ncbi:MAG: hypothetical protein AABY00_04145, partial [Nanoarchaeota archaeon]
FTKIVFIVSPLTYKSYLEYFGSSYRGIQIVYAFQKYDSVIRDKPWGTADAICSAAPFLTTPFVLCNGDDLYGASSFEQASEFLKNFNDNVMIGYQLKEVVPDLGEVNRAIIRADEHERIMSVREEFGVSFEKIEKGILEGNALCSMNLFGMHQFILQEIQKKVDDFKKESKSRTAECLLPEVLNMLINENKSVFRVIPAHERWIGITYLSDVERVKGQLKN